jgi:hypothetical protein
MFSRVRASIFNDQFHLYDLSRPAVGGQFQPVASIDLPLERGRLHGYAAHPGLLGIAYVTETEAVRLGADGRVLWRLELGSPLGQTCIATANCGFSLDGGLVWIYQPDAMMNRGPDRIRVVDTSGVVVAEAHLETVGQGAVVYAHLDGHMIVDVGEGQDGINIFRCQIQGDELAVHAYPWIDRVLIGFSPDGTQFMTVDHGFAEDVAFHAYPGGEVLTTLTMQDFGEQPEEATMEWSGGYLDPGTAVVTIIGYDEDADTDWHQHYLVDIAAGAVRGEWDVESTHPHDIEPLGDGTWLLVRDDGRLERHAS